LTCRRAVYYLGQVKAKGNADEHLRAIKRDLDSHPSTAPKAKSIDEIMHILFMPDEAAIDINMSYEQKKTTTQIVSKGDEGERYQHA
jgi:hypothetical protein